MQAENQKNVLMVYAGLMKTGRPAQTPRSDFGSRLHALREAAGLSQQEVADQLGISQPSYALWERKTSAIRAEHVVKLAEVLGVKVEDLYNGNPKSARRGGPSGRAKRVFEEVSDLPRQKQKRILDVVEDLLIARKA